MRSKQPKKRFQVGYKPSAEIYKKLQRISEQDFGRSVSGIVGIIVNQYLASTNGRLLKNIKIIPTTERES